MFLEPGEVYHSIRKSNISIDIVFASKMLIMHKERIMMREVKDTAAVKKRIEYIDIVRGFAMLCIIAGHMGNNTIMRIVFTFHVPVFFIISGLFYRQDISSIRSNATKLIKPYAFTVLCVTLLDGIKVIIQQKGSIDGFSECINVISRDLVAGLYGSGSRVDFLNIKLTPIGAIWFYLALIWALLFCWIILHIEKKLMPDRNKGQFMIVVSLFLAALFWIVGFITAKRIWLPFSVQAGFSSVIFVIFGIILKEQFFKSNNPFWSYLVAGIVWFVSLYFSLRNDYMSIVRSAFPNPIINILGAVAATWLLFGIGKKTESNKITNPLKHFGKYSMVVLSFHLIELNCFPWNKIINLDFIGLSVINRLLVFCAKIIWCCLGIELARRIKVLKWIYSIKE